MHQRQLLRALLISVALLAPDSGSPVADSGKFGLFFQAAAKDGDLPKLRSLLVKSSREERDDWRFLLYMALFQYGSGEIKSGDLQTELLKQVNIPADVVALKEALEWLGRKRADAETISTKRCKSAVATGDSTYAKPSAQVLIEQ